MGGQPLEVLVLRAWLEPTGEPSLRVRVVLVSPGEADRSVLTTTSAEEVCTAVRNWLMTLEEQAGPPTP
jgi:hypothetical protein